MSKELNIWFKEQIANTSVRFWTTLTHMKTVIWHWYIDFEHALLRVSSQTLSNCTVQSLKSWGD